MKIYLEKAKQKYPFLLNEHICEKCGNKFILTYCQIKSYCKRLDKKEQIHFCCSRSCSSSLQSKIHENPFSRPEIIEKIRNKRKNDIDENGNNSYKRAIIKGLETKRNDIDENGLNGCQRILIKNHKKCKELYDVENPFASKDPELNGQATKERKYNNRYYNNHEQAMETNKRNHGGKHNWACDDPKLNGRATRQKEYGDPYWSNREKAEQTTFIRHGKEYYIDTEEFKNYMKRPEVQKQKQQREYETKKRNGTLINYRSKPEKHCFTKVKEKFHLSEHTYRDNKRYPFKCDIYIPEKDLFIECHFGWKHGGEPFDFHNVKHVELLNKWKLKSKDISLSEKVRKSYQNAIYQWIDLDVRKLKTFINNKLNYKIFYTEKEFNKWFSSLP